MKILIVGCGKIGTAIVSEMVAEGHDVTAMDTDAEVLTSLSNIYDIMSVCGDGVNCELLEEAGIHNTDLLVAATGSDEVNLLCCFLGKKLGAQHSVARVRNPGHSDRDLRFMRENLDISMVINPEQMAAQELFTLLKVPSAMKVEAFSRRNFQLIEMRVRPNSGFDGAKLMDLRSKYDANFLVCVVHRGEDVIIPDGQFTLKAGDHIGIAATTDQIHRLLREMNLLQKEARRVMILGGSRTAIYLARLLTDVGISVKIIEQDEQRCKSLCEKLPKASIVCGDGSRQELLLEEGLQNHDAFVTLTGMDEENILISYFAVTMNVPTIVTKVNRNEMQPMAERLGLDVQISPKRTVTDMISRYARALENTVGSNIETLYHLMDGKAEALEFIAKNSTRLLNVPLRDLNLKPNILIAGIIRERTAFIPGGNDMILMGDRVVVLAADQRLQDLTDILK